MINVSGFSRKTVAGRLLRWMLDIVPDSATVWVIQGPMRGARWIAGSSTKGCWLGTYEAPKQQLFASLVRRGMTVLDIGANVGFYSLLASRLVGPSGRVVAFEPVPRNIRFLREHLRLNGSTNVEVVEAAVSGTSGTATFAQGAGNAYGALAPSGDLVVTTVTIDALVASGRIPDPSVLKIDVEGAELDVLAGARDTIDRLRPIMFVATHSAALHASVLDILTSRGYRVDTGASMTALGDDEIVAIPSHASGSQAW